MLGVNPIIGQSMAHCVGAGMAINLRKGDDVAVSYLGDSAVGCGVFNESINLATIMNAPVVFVCENNQYAVTTPVEYAIAGKIIDRAAAYGIPGVKIDGMDVFAVYEAGAGGRRTRPRRRRPFFHRGADLPLRGTLDKGRSH